MFLITLKINLKNNRVNFKANEREESETYRGMSQDFRVKFNTENCRLFFKEKKKPPAEKTAGGKKLNKIKQMKGLTRRGH